MPLPPKAAARKAAETMKARQAERLAKSPMLDGKVDSGMLRLLLHWQHDYPPYLTFAALAKAHARSPDGISKLVSRQRRIAANFPLVKQLRREAQRYEDFCKEKPMAAAVLDALVNLK